MNTAHRSNPPNPLQARVLVCSPQQDDVVQSVQVLKAADFVPVICNDMDTVCQSLKEHVGALVLALELLTPLRLAELVRILEQCPPGSAPNMIILADAEENDYIRPLASTLNTLSQAIFLTRPISALTLSSTVNAALNLNTCRQQNQQLSAQLEKSALQRDEFLAMLGHELRNPLAAISNAVTLLKQVETDYPPLVTTQQILDRQTEHLTTLLNQLLDVSRITRGLVQLSKNPMNLAEVINEVLTDGDELIAQRQPWLVVSLPAEPLLVDADPLRLKQVLTNLLHNAVKYSSPKAQIELAAKRVGERIEINVRDNGVGMTPEMLGEVFDSFAQAKRSLDRSPGGLGVGLTVAKRLVELHGGEISATSPGPGQGSEFVVRLPAGSRLESAPAESTPAATGENHSLQLLVVDDNRDAARSLGLLLEGLGHQVQLAYDGQSALDMARSHKPQAILLDLGLPKLNGYQVAQCLRADARFEKALFIAITGYGGKENRLRAEAAGFDHHLTKPVKLESLQALLMRL
ncbi:MAG: hybrid sensor histidine kinase/response regulator [Candidatus Competibacteraceae bacterium]